MQGRSRPAALGFDVDDGRLQFRMLEGQHPGNATKSGLRQRDSITRVELLRAPRDDPQPRAGSGVDRATASSRCRRSAACATAPVPAAWNPGAPRRRAGAGTPTTRFRPTRCPFASAMPVAAPCRRRAPAGSVAVRSGSPDCKAASSGSSTAGSPTSSRAPAVAGRPVEVHRSHSRVNKRLLSSFPAPRACSSTISISSISSRTCPSGPVSNTCPTNRSASEVARSERDRADALGHIAVDADAGQPDRQYHGGLVGLPGSQVGGRLGAHRAPAARCPP